MKLYKDKQLVDGGSGSLHNITSVTYKHNIGFNFKYSYLQNLKGTVLCWETGVESVYVFVADYEIPRDELLTFDDDRCYEWIFQHVIVKDLVDMFYKVASKKYQEGKRDFAADLRDFIGIESPR